VGRAATTPSHQKLTGAHFTPPGLARFLAARIVKHLPSRPAPLEIWDPSCGDGSLLAAIQEALLARSAHFHGLDTEAHSITSARLNLRPVNSQTASFAQADFLDYYTQNLAPADLFSDERQRASADVIIANPPYVRTQVLGASVARRLAAAFNLTGRVDLYHAFMVAMTSLLRPGGIIGVIASNRFMFTQAGASIRELWLKNYKILEIFDLGDTKFFKAAVLPCIIIARKGATGKGNQIPFTRIYESTFDPQAHVLGKDRDALFECLGNGGVPKVTINKTTFKIATGILDHPSSISDTWSLRDPAEAQWVTSIKRTSHTLVGDVVKVKVGIKTTADNVFIRNDWDTLPEHLQPEKELLLPLTDRFRIERWLPKTHSACPRVLYPYDPTSSKRRPISLESFPKAAAYLQSHKRQLEGRDYVVNAGREWFEIWVPHQPRDWALPKVVFPDIAQKPTFALITDGSIVNGNCYWICAPSPSGKDILFLLMGVCNSRFIEHYHDIAFNNKLYSGRRRFLTQYVSKYPLPDLDSTAASQIIALVAKLLRENNGHYEIQSSIEQLLQDYFKVRLPKVN